MINSLIFFLFILVSFILIILILFNPVDNNTYYLNNYNKNFSIFYLIYHSSLVNVITKFFIILFFLLSIIMCIFGIS